MAKYLNKTAIVKGDSTLVFQLNAEANERIKNNEKVINATVGSMLNKDGTLTAFSYFNECLNKVNLDETKRYAPLDGGQEFNSNIQKWILSDLENSIKNKYKVASVCTMGGTGAIALAFNNYAENHILLPDIGWSNYELIAENAHKSVGYYPLFNKEGDFNIAGLLSCIATEAKYANKVTVVINDPAHNPTGYSLSKDEWKILIDQINYLNKACPIVIILDVAYIDFAKENRNFFEAINEVKMEFLTLVCVSLSKTLGIYGLRTGALMYVGEADEVEEFVNSSKLYIRATWSNPNHIAIDAFNLLMKNEDEIKNLNLFLKEQCELLHSRANYVLKNLSNELGEALSYRDGFFITYKKDNANDFALKLKEKNIFVLPLKNKFLRFAVCSFINEDK